MKITTVRITDEQHEWITNNRQNQLSRIVREHIDELMHSETPVNFHNAWREGAQKCYPFMKGGYCALCWPAGIPDRSHWLDYVKAFPVGSRGRLTFEEWSMSKHARRQATLDDWNRDSRPDQVAEQKRASALSNKSGIFGWIRRLFG